MASSSDLESHKPCQLARDTLTKACNFARQYTEEQVKHILKGKFVHSWFELAQSLTVAPQNLITAYQESSSPSEFHNAIIKSKTPDPRKGTVIPSAVSDRGQVAEDNIDGLKDGENLFDVHNDHATFLHVPRLGIKTEQRIWSSGIHSWDDLLGGDFTWFSRMRRDILKRTIEDSIEHLCRRFNRRNAGVA